MQVPWKWYNGDTFPYRHAGDGKGLAWEIVSVGRLRW